MRRISFVVPVFNEEESIPVFLKTMEETLAPLTGAYTFDYVFVNDGSRDKTLEVLVEAKKQYPAISIVDFSRNFGKEAALTAGIDNSKGDAVIPMDVDLQDPPEVVPKLIKKWEEGYEVVLARRADRSSDSRAKRLTALWFYQFINIIAKPQIPENVGDFRLMDRKVVEALKRLPERRRFMKGLFAWVGFNTAVVDYERQVRQAGVTKFSGWKLWNFALEGITSFSTALLEIWTYIGLLISSSAFLYLAYIILRTLLFGRDIEGYSSTLATILFLGGAQMVGLGILGVYIGRIYVEVKNRPIYIVRDYFPEG
ncbi:MAG: glycosyltransferase family 2 protein [Methylobacteriaceae bacterium]|jgi:glycosyltransferase involved in cell wall biosynthesis|nr:glycosyltransferase family 2 protein [Methylobacteriaceae bacterium]